MARLSWLLNLVSLSQISSAYPNVDTFARAVLPGCNADNCLRAVGPTKSLARASSDCSSFLRATVTPATSTIHSMTTRTVYTTISDYTTAFLTPLPTTETSTIFATTTEVIADVPDIPTSVLKRQITAIPSSVPIYATPCSGTVRYSSACSCLGVTASTKTLPAPIVVVVVTATSTSTVYVTIPATSTFAAVTSVTYTTDVVATATATCFVLEVSSGTASAGTLVGHYLQLIQSGNSEKVVPTAELNTAAKFSIDEFGDLTANSNNGFVAGIFQNDPPISDVWFSEPEEVNYPLGCSLSTNGVLTCAAFDDTTWFICNGDPGIQIGTPSQGTNGQCNALTLQALGTSCQQQKE